MIMHLLKTTFASTLLFVAACSTLPATTERHPAAVAAPDTYSAAVAAEVLSNGGNAVDAAVAVGFSLAVTLPEAGNIGGGGFMLLHFDGKAAFIDYRERAPFAAHRDMYLDAEGNVIKGASTIGHLAAGVPGAVAGLWAAHQRYGELPWKDVLAPAIRLARDGFEVHEILARNVARVEPRFAGKTNFGDYFGGLQAGDVHVQEELARTLERIAEQGPDGFYKGETADLIVAEMQRGDGLISHRDLAEYAPVWREPLRAGWRGLELLSSPPPSSGGFAVVQLLKMKDYLAREFEGLAHNSAQYVHLVAEMEKRVFADRAEYLGDPDFTDNRMDELLDEDYLKARAAEVKPNEISTILEATPGLESYETTHYSIMDHDGNAAAITTTLNLGFGSGVVVEGAGFLLNDEMDDFSVKPGVPNAFGVVGFEANEIQPGKRMLSSMSPTMLVRDGEVELVIGTPGGSTIFTTVFQAIASMYDYGMTPLEAAGASRFHHQLLPPDRITYSPNVPLPQETISTLGDMGYRVVPHSYPYGDLQIVFNNANGMQAASDPRKRGESRVLSADGKPDGVADVN
jgi:gamma-glutamyltranspeptidase/glutathione hydrolase